MGPDSAEESWIPRHWRYTTLPPNWSSVYVCVVCVQGNLGRNKIRFVRNMLITMIIHTLECYWDQGLFVDAQRCVWGWHCSLHLNSLSFSHSHFLCFICMHLRKLLWQGCWFKLLRNCNALMIKTWLWRVCVRKTLLYFISGQSNKCL